MTAAPSRRSRFAKILTQSGRRAAAYTRSTHGNFLHRQEADPQDLRARRRSRADAKPDRGAKELLRSLLADGGSAGTTRQCRAPGGVQIGIPDPRFLGARPARVRALRARNSEIRGR